MDDGLSPLPIALVFLFPTLLVTFILCFHKKRNRWYT